MTECEIARVIAGHLLHGLNMGTEEVTETDLRQVTDNEGIPLWEASANTNLGIAVTLRDEDALIAAVGVSARVVEIVERARIRMGEN